ncbi:hypothetical protein HNY73_009469 [Argiope bruennichi]|uniref:DUF7041 domain-containing protein n=1 Tax=Argiope bruennichi TaxID=94029 RepID=A0A8T0FF79_ARGBR|nr:hypothetical protein HNY73_009469 [Argiope bruennichi]
MATAETAAVVIPPFIKPDPALWFHMLDFTFELASPKAITESKTKYNYVVAHLPPEIATVVRDVIIQPDSTGPYSDLKTNVIKRCYWLICNSPQDPPPSLRECLSSLLCVVFLSETDGGALT